MKEKKLRFTAWLVNKKRFVEGYMKPLGKGKSLIYFPCVDDDIPLASLDEDFEILPFGSKKHH